MSSPAGGGFSITHFTDPALARMPESAANAYANMNENIATMYGMYGASIQKAHLARSQAAIMQTAAAGLERSATGEPRSALILGAGNCFDIPVADITDNFDRTVFVDVHTEGTERALSDLTSKQLAKVSLIDADVTGAMTDFTFALEEASQDAPDYSTFIRRVSHIMSQCDPNTAMKPSMGEEYTFVCSQLLLTQLCAIPNRYIRDTVATKFGQSIVPGGADPLLWNLNELVGRTQTDHISHLARLVGKSGSVHFADTYAELKHTPRGTQVLPMVLYPVVAPKIDAHFSNITPTDEWFWQVAPGKDYYVVSNSLAPRPNID